MTYELHPLCTLFPRMAGDEFAALVADIKANGLRNPIVLHDGMILDGGNRYRACIESGVEPLFDDFEGGNLVSFVLSNNMHRRHLTAGQQAAIVASAQDWALAQRPGGDGRNQHQGPATLPGPQLSTVADRSAQSGASERTQRMADKVAKADPALAKQVAHGEVSLPKALAKVEGNQAKRPPSAQQLEAQQIADDAHGDFDPLAELQLADKRIAELEAVVEAAEADDQTAETMKWRTSAAVHERRSNEHLETIAKRDKEIAFLSRQLQRCGKAVGELDLDKIPAAVAKMARTAGNGASA